MIKRTIIMFVIFLLGIIFLGIGHGFSNIGDFTPLLPPLIAIALAFITHEVLISLFMGIFLGSIMTYEINGFGNFFIVIGKGFFKSVDTYVVKGVADSDHVSIIVFTMFIGGVVGLIGASGGLHGIVFRLAKFAKSSVLAQFYAWLMGIMIFFDDYANTLIVGNAMRPITDKFKISREKLSFIVDATAAPVSSLVIVSTWIGYEVGLIQDIFKAQAVTMDPYWAFIYSLPYRFYVILMLLFIPIMIFMKKDMFSMYIAEKRARETGGCLRPGSNPISGDEETEINLDDGVKPRARNAIIPIATLVLGVLVALYYTGYQSILAKSGVDAAVNANLRDILGNSNSFNALIWSSLFSTLVIIIMILFQRVMNLKDTMLTWVKGCKSMFSAFVILSLAWALGGVLKDLKTAECVAQLVSDNVAVGLLPLIIFLVSALIAFATGTSWGSMAILFPIAVPLALKLTTGLPVEEGSAILYASIGSILSGTVFGDHCSPISDTTIMSSIATSIDHMDHVSTQLPYALFVGIISCGLGYLPVGFGLNPWIGNIIALMLIAGVLFVFGKKVKNIRA